jgi:DNA phosphorothioation-dependent restriction protein DptG
MIKKEFDLNDVFTISEIIDKMGLEADVDKITKTIQKSKLENKKDATTLGKEIIVGIGIDMVTKLIRNLFKAQKEVKKLISSLTGLNEEEVSKMGIKQIKEFFTELFQSDGIEDFLSQAGESKETK